VFLAQSSAMSRGTVACPGAPGLDEFKVASNPAENASQRWERGNAGQEFGLGEFFFLVCSIRLMNMAQPAAARGVVAASTERLINASVRP
jgi:hypothetical protein